jgi:hypothetical protein
VKAMGLGSKLFEKLVFVLLFTAFLTFVGFTQDFLKNFLIVTGLMVTSWIVVMLLLRFSK